MNEALVTSEEFAQAQGAKREYELVPPGKYLVGLLNSTVRVKLSKAGNRYITVSAGTRSDEEGNEIFSKIIYKMIMFEGTYTVKSGDNAGQERKHKSAFIKFAIALGLDQDETSDLYASLLENSPTVEELSSIEGNFADVSLDVGGEVFDLKGKTFMANVDVEEYNGTERNVIHGMWSA